MKILTKNQSQTRKEGEILAKKILKRPAGKKALVLALEGGLGGGKTTFLQGFARGLGIKEKVLSPTFVIMKRFPLEGNKSRFRNFFHLDCYRIKGPKDLDSLEFKKIINDPSNLVAVEWSERIKKSLPKKRIRMKFEFKDKNTRNIFYSND